MLRLDNFKLFYTIENNCVLFKIKEKHCNEGKILIGALRESNPRPLPPKGRIIPLDQRPM